MYKIFFIIILFLSVNLRAKTPPAASFLDINVGAKAGGLGNAFTSIADDVTALFWNPSSISTFTKKVTGITHYLYFADISYNFIGYVQPVSDYIGSFGVGLYLLNTDNIPITMEDSNNSDKMSSSDFGTFSFSDFAVSVSYAKKIFGFPIGATLKYIYEKLYNISASGFGFDLGVKYNILKNSKTVSAFTVKNIGFLKSESDIYSLPLSFNLGFHTQFIKNIIISFDIKIPYYNNASFKTGFQYDFKIGNILHLYPRIGYISSKKVAKYISNTDEYLITDGFNGFAFGGGIYYKIKTFDINFDYMLAPSEDLGSVHKISAGVKF